ncbi:hypothetical protein [Actinomadura alba]|uniref:hypothetical protein n=1 Tax=Actinomadura alba TaxID=406431 RepID=UPI0031DCD2DD
MTAVTYQEHATPARRAALIGPDGTYTRVGQTLAFILGFISLVFVPATVVAAMLYTHGEARFATDPERARKLMNWSWIALLVWPVPFLCVGLVRYAVSAAL